MSQWDRYFDYEISRWRVQMGSAPSASDPIFPNDDVNNPPSIAETDAVIDSTSAARNAPPAGGPLAPPPGAAPPPAAPGQVPPVNVQPGYQYLALQQQAELGKLQSQTQRDIAAMDDATRRWLAGEERRLQLELQSGNITLQKYLQERQLAQQESEFARNYVIEQANLRLRERRAVLDEELANAMLRANPRDWVPNAYKQRGLTKEQAGMLAGQRPPTDEELQNMPWLRSIQLNQPLPAFQRPAGQVGEGGPFGIQTLSPTQITAPVFEALSPVEQEMLAGLTSAQGQDPSDFFSRMFASQIRGTARPGVLVA